MWNARCPLGKSKRKAEAYKGRHREVGFPIDDASPVRLGPRDLGSTFLTTQISLRDEECRRGPSLAPRDDGGVAALTAATRDQRVACDRVLE